MTAGRAAAAAAMVASASAAAVLLLLAGGAYADDCYDDCFSDCMPRFNNQQDYCSYACDKVCNPDADATPQHPLADVGPETLADHRHQLDKKHQDADAVRPAALPDHPFHKTHSAGGGVKPAGEPDPGHVVHPARVPVLP